MMISKAYMGLIYMASVILFFNYTSPFIFWVMTELNLLFFIMMIYLFSNINFKQEMFDLTLFYFLIQSMASIFLLSDFFFSEDFFIFNSDTMFITSILIKLGIFPFFYWVYKITNFLNYWSLSLLLTFQKIPFYFILFSSFSSIILYLLLFSFLTGSILLLFSKDFIFMLVSSSISSSFWIFYLFSFSFYFFIFYYIIYTSILFHLIYCYMSDNKMSSKLWLSLFSFSFLLGLSPFSLFFFKFSLMGYFFFNLGVIDSVFFWFFSFLTLFGYMSFSLKGFFWSSQPYFMSIKFSYELFIFFFSLTFFFFFMI